MASKTHKTWQEELAGKIISNEEPPNVMTKVSQLSADNDEYHHQCTTLFRTEEVQPSAVSDQEIQWLIHAGGRTAWSSTVTIQDPQSIGRNLNLAARYWYDGQFLNNAKEDAAEVACTKIRNPSITQPQSPQYTQAGYTGGRGVFR